MSCLYLCGDTWELQDSHANMKIMPQSHARGSKDMENIHFDGECLEVHLVVPCGCLNSVN